MSREILIVGSVPLASSEDVFGALARQLGSRARRLPDGETGPARSKWILCQKPVFEASRSFEAFTAQPEVKYSQPPAFQLSEFGRREPVEIGSLGYADWALASYETFSRLKAEGVIHQTCRMQVCLPTPLAVLARFLDPASQVRAARAYEKALDREIQTLCRQIDHDELAIQFDVSNEFGFIEGIWSSPLVGDDPMRTIVDVAALGDLVPLGVQLGYHLCYGDFGHQHFVQPQDSGHLVKVANLLAAETKRPIDWIHLPIPRERDDPAYFAPMKDFQLNGTTTLFLGLVHLTDGVEGAHRRMAAADPFVGDYGLATECGWGRRAPETIPPLLELHRAL